MLMDMKVGVLLLISGLIWNGFRLYVLADGGAAVLDPGLGNLISNFGVIGVLVWHLWYHTTKGYPQMVAAFGAESEKLRLTFEKARTDGYTESEKLRSTFEKSLAIAYETFTKEQKETRDLFIQTMAGFRTAVHDVKDTAQTAMASDAVKRHKEQGKMPEHHK